MQRDSYLMTFLKGYRTDKYKMHSFSVCNIHLNIYFEKKVTAGSKILLLIKQLLSF